MPQILRAAAPHDLLSVVPNLAGFQPRECLVVIAFRGPRTLGAFRYGLTAGRRDRDTAAIAAAAIGTLCRMRGADAVIPVVYTDDSFAEAGGTPEPALGRLLVERARQAGFLVRDALCVAHDGWASYLDEAAPRGGRPLALIEESELRRELDPGAEEPGEVDELARTPMRDRNRARRIARLAVRLREASSGDDAALDPTRRGLDRIVPAELIDRLLDDGAEAARDDTMAWLLVLAQSPAMRDALTLELAFGDAPDDGTPEGDRFLGLGGRAPDPARLRRAVEVLQRLIADAPRAQTPALLCIAAWLAWALGRGSAAGMLLERALAVDPGNSMARLLHDYLGSGAIPEWAFAAGAS